MYLFFGKNQVRCWSVGRSVGRPPQSPTSFECPSQELDYYVCRFAKKVICIRFCTRVYIILQGRLPPKKYPQIHMYLKFGRGGFPPPGAPHRWVLLFADSVRYAPARTRKFLAGRIGWTPYLKPKYKNKKHRVTT